MLSRRIRGLWNAYHGILAVILTVLFWSGALTLAIVLRDRGIHDFERYILYNLAALFGLTIAAIRERSSAATLLAGDFGTCVHLAFKQSICVGGAILVVLAITTSATVSHLLLLFSFLLILWVVLLLCHLFLPTRLAGHLFSDEYEQRTLLIGPVDKARAIAKWIDETAAFGFGMRGSVTDDDGGEESRVLHVTRVSDVAMLQRFITHEGIKQIILLEIPLDPEGLNLVVKAANKGGVRLLVLNNLTEIFRHNITFFNLHEKDFISLRDEPLEDPVNRILKRTIDIIVSLPVVVFVLPPLSILVKVFQLIQSPGPLFYRQTRAGLANLPFRIFKFRTMRVDKGDDASQQATAGDPRIYPMGRLLRRTSLDEMPQFLNVFLGHMSLVGPRPHMIIHNRQFSEIMDEYRVRTFAKPGITGLAQMSGFRGEAKNDEDVRKRAKLDIKYIENWSLAFDFWIIFRTMYQVVKPPKTAY